MHTSGSAPAATPDSGDVRVTGGSAYVSSLTTPGVASVDGLDLPILDEVPLLGSAIALVRGIDRLVAQLLEVLIELEDHEVAEATTGVMLEQWLAIAGRRTGSDRRMLLTACGVLRRLPSLRAAFCDQAVVSWAQVRAVVLAVHRLPRTLDEVIDGELARTIDACREADPDMLTSAVSRAARSWDPVPTQKAQQAADRDEFIAMQPRLDGSRGQLFGELGPVSFATVDAALTAPGRPTLDPADHRNLDERDLARGDDQSAEPCRPAEDPPADGVAPRARVGQLRARRLVALCDAGLQGAQAHGPHDGGVHAAGGTGGASRPQLLVRIELASLLDRSAMPAELLTHLTGGKLWLDATTGRRLVEERGADLRSIVLDERGRIVGVGRRSRIAPGWLADATLALHDTCTHPDCRMPARRCQTDHATPWQPVRPEDPPGRTDIDQLAPMCAHHNRTKEISGWRVSQSADGTRRWTHPRSGLTTVTAPATWRPVGRAPERYDSAGLDPGPEQVGGALRRSPAEAYRPARDGPSDLAREARADYIAMRQRPPPAMRQRPPPQLRGRPPQNRRRPAQAGPRPCASPARGRRRWVHSLATGGSEGSPDPGRRTQPGQADVRLDRLEALQRCR